MMDKTEFIVTIQDKLCALYGCPIRHWDATDPLSELVHSLLSHRTKNRDSHRAFLNLKEKFPSWENVRDAEVADIQACLNPCTWPEQKAPRLKQVLQKIMEQHGALSLDFLGDLDVAAARKPLPPLCRSACCAPAPCRSTATISASPCASA